MSSETKICQNCKSSFTIEPDDFSFYEKIQVPAPTWCPECRMVRRLLWRNEYNFYKRPCNAPGHTEEVVSLYSPEAPRQVFDQKFWWSDGWDPIAYSKEYDFSRPFFEQFRELMQRVPVSNLMGNYATLVRSEYTNWGGGLKDCYLTTDSDYVENSAYGSGIFDSKECFDCDTTSGSELCYDGFNLKKCYRAVSCVNCHESSDILFCKGCLGCNHCFGCMNLRNKSYHIFNRPYPKEEYERKVAELWDGSWSAFKKNQAAASELWIRHPHKNLRGLHNSNSFGDYIYNSKNTEFGFLVQNVEDSKYVALIHSPGTKDCYDYTDWGENAERLYECITVGLGAYNVRFSHMVFNSVRDIEYSFYCCTSANLFGCVGVRNKQYCILNKQYTKEEYEDMVPRIIQHMNDMPYVDEKDRVYRYGEFFPPEIAPFTYDEAVTHEYFPATEEEAIKRGYRWKGQEKKDYGITISHAALPERISEVPKTIVNEVIGCAHEGKCNHGCTVAFRIVPQELAFYRRMNLPLPRLCFKCRHFERVLHRNPFKLWHRTCQCAGMKSENGVHQNAAVHPHGASRCPNEFETSYSPERKEIVYCEQCYSAEVA
jgi:hypothetical protein